MKSTLTLLTALLLAPLAARPLNLLVPGLREASGAESKGDLSE